jgi:hypothetical protein
VFLGEGFVGGDVIDADTDHDGVQFAKGEDIVAKFTRLRGAAGGVVLGVKIQHQPVPAVFAGIVPGARLVL